jgi:predicted RNA-binding protein with PUA-like domain
MAKRYWLMKSEPDCYSIDDLKREKTTVWDGVRNYQAFKQKFSRAVPLPELREKKGLEKMVLLQRGSRLSVQPLTEKEFEIIMELGSKKE